MPNRDGEADLGVSLPPVLGSCCSMIFTTFGPKAKKQAQILLIIDF